MNDDNKGLSLVLLNTEKGKELFEAINQQLDMKEVDVYNCLQPNLQHPSIIHPERAEFEQSYSKKGFGYVIKRYGEYGWRYRWGEYKKKVKRIINKIIKL